MEFVELASGLEFPEGPIAMDDGSVILTEIARQTLTRVTPDGRVEVVAETGGGPNGAAIGPDGHVWITNNGGFRVEPLGRPSAAGRTGARTTRRARSSGSTSKPARSRPSTPSATGFRSRDRTTSSSTRPAASGSRTWARTANTTATWARSTTPKHRRLVTSHAPRFPIPGGANGVGLSPNGDTHVYIAETPTGRLFGWEIAEPGVLAAGQRGGGLHCVHRQRRRLHTVRLARR